MFKMTSDNLRPHIVSFQLAQNLFRLLLGLFLFLFNINDGGGSHARSISFTLISTCRVWLDFVNKNTKVSILLSAFSYFPPFLFIIISAGPCSNIECDWMTSGTPRPRPLPRSRGPRPRSWSLRSRLCPPSAFCLTRRSQSTVRKGR